MAFVIVTHAHYAKVSLLEFIGKFGAVALVATFYNSKYINYYQLYFCLTVNIFTFVI